MDRIFEKAQDEVKEPGVFFNTVHELMQGRHKLTRQDLNELKQLDSGNARINETAKVLDEHFDDIHNLAVEPKKLDSTFGDYHNRIFSESNKPEGALSEKELEIFEKMFDHPAEESELNWSTYGRIAKRSLQTIAAGAGTVFFDGLVIVAPEPMAKALSFAAAVGCAHSMISYAGNLFEPAGTLLQHEYEKRQAMIDSWKFFKQKAEY